MAYEPPEIETDEEAVAVRVLQGMADAMPGWEPIEGAPEFALATEISREATETNQLAVDSLDFQAAGLGQTVYQLAPRTSAYAVLPDVTITFTPVAPGPAGLADSTVPAGFTIVAAGVAFQLLEDVTPTSTDPLHVTMQAVEPGTQGNISVQTPIAAEVVTSSVSVASVTVNESGLGGVDDEPLAAYLDRLVDYVALLRPGGVRASDLAALARTVNGVQRAIGIDLYDPADPAPPSSQAHERTATVIAIDDDGLPVTNAELAAVLEAAREVNFVIHLGEPTYTSVDVVIVATADPGADPAAVDTAVTAAVTAYLHPRSWGSTAADPNTWTERTQVRVFDIAGVVFDVPGVATVESVTINGSTSTLTLPGPGALPTSPDDLDDPSTVTVTVT